MSSPSFPSYAVPSSHRLHSSFGHPLLKAWQGSDPVRADNLVYPIFILDEGEQTQPILSMPEQHRWPVALLPDLLAPLVASGLRSVLLFGVLTDDKKKNAQASYCTHKDTPILRAIALIKRLYPSLYIMCDICLCAYTDHGHCGIVDSEGNIDNEKSIMRIAEMAVCYGAAGAHCVAPSDMMDGRIGAIKCGLRSAGLDGRVSLCSYAAKFASAFYGPFRDAAGSGAKFGDRSNYQLPPCSRGLAMRAVDRDVQEGADMVMVKPGGPYLDIVRDVAERVNMPVAIYHVSGEYAMLWHAAQAGAFKLEESVMETLNGFKRAGANILITYYTPRVLEWLNK